MENKISYATKKDVKEIVDHAVGELSITIDELATMTSQEFANVKVEISDVRTGLNQDITELRTELRSETRDEFSKVHTELNNIKED